LPPAYAISDRDSHAALIATVPPIFAILLHYITGQSHFDFSPISSGHTFFVAHFISLTLPRRQPRCAAELTPCALAAAPDGCAPRAVER